MISNNYVPEWHISPFEHSKYTLVRNQDQFDLLFDDMNDTQEFMHLGAGAQVDYYDGGKHCIVQLGDCDERTLIEVHGLLLHEAVHIWQRIKKLMGEKSQALNLKLIQYSGLLRIFLQCFGRVKLMGWKNKPTNFALEIEKIGDEHLRKVSAEMLQGVIMGSPVMDGAFRSNHRVTVNKTTNETVPSNGNKAPKGTLDQEVFAEGAGQILQAKLGDSVYIQNNLPYALRLENGHSQQASLGIYSLTFLSVASKYK